MIDTIRWGIIGCGNVAEFKSGPPLYQTPGSELIAVMRRDAAKAADFARRHGARRWYTDAEALITDADVNAIYIASSDADAVSARELLGADDLAQELPGNATANRAAVG